MLVRRGHDAWTAAQAGLNQEPDDTLTVYAYERDAVLLTHDREFSQRRRKNVVAGMCTFDATNGMPLAYSRTTLTMW